MNIADLIQRHGVIRGFQAAFLSQELDELIKRKKRTSTAIEANKPDNESIT